MNHKGIELIKKHEGLRLYLYECTAGKKTIGYGRNIEDNGITQAEADLMLDEDVVRCIHELTANVPCFRDLDEVRESVLVNMCFNLGWPRLSGFKNMLAALADRDYTKAAEEMLDSKWARQVGSRSDELAAMMASGEWL